jgi:hypothetical protein
LGKKKNKEKSGMNRWFILLFRNNLSYILFVKVLPFSLFKNLKGEEIPVS